MPPILVLRLSSLGDIVLTSSFLQSCRDHFPDSAVHFVVRDDLAPLAALLPGVERVIAVSRDAGAGTLLALGARLAREPYHHVFDLHQSLRSKLLTWRLQPRLRRGFSKQSVPRWLLVHLHRDAYVHFGGARPLRERMLEPLRRLGFEPPLRATRLELPAAVRAAARSRLEDCGLDGEERLVGIAPGARWPSKRWPEERFAALLSRLATEGDPAFLVFGNHQEKGLTSRVASASPRAFDFGGSTDLVTTAALLQHCRLLVTNDSGLLHVAEAVGCPVLALFGPTTPAFGYAPSLPASRLLYEPPSCNPCSKNGSRPCHRRQHDCMLALKVDAAQAAVQAMLAAAACTLSNP